MSVEFSTWPLSRPNYFRTISKYTEKRLRPNLESSNQNSKTILRVSGMPIKVVVRFGCYYYFYY